MCTDIDRIAELVREDPQRQFFSIAHLITVEKMYEAFRGLRKDASAGIDGVTYEQYANNAEENIRQLHQRLKEGKYQVQPLRRVYIPKEDGKQRPISIPALEDKLVQKVVVDLRRKWTGKGTPPFSPVPFWGAHPRGKGHSRFAVRSDRGLERCGEQWRGLCSPRYKRWAI